MKRSSWVKLRPQWNDLFKGLSSQDSSSPTHRHLHSLIKLWSHGSHRFPNVSSQHPQTWFTLEPITEKSEQWAHPVPNVFGSQSVFSSTGSLSVIFRKATPPWDLEGNANSPVPLQTYSVRDEQSVLISFLGDYDAHQGLQTIV